MRKRVKKSEREYQKRERVVVRKGKRQQQKLRDSKRKSKIVEDSKK